ncbi:unnamed protein product, partial [Symbiodinium necroappetens]
VCGHVLPVYGPLCLLRLRCRSSFVADRKCKMHLSGYCSWACARCNSHRDVASLGYFTLALAQLRRQLQPQRCPLSELGRANGLPDG